MGVPGLVPWLSSHYRGISRMAPPPIIDGVLIDVNAVIHPCVHSDGVSDLSMEEMMEAVKQMLSGFIEQLKPRGYVYFAMDGVAPRAKMVQQRVRRYTSAASRAGSDGTQNFDSNAISPGTAFMEAVSDCIQQMMPVWARRYNVHLVLSDTSVPGEGEHKALDFLRSHYSRSDTSDQVHVVVGSDADLVLLALTVPTCNVYLMREFRSANYTKYEFISSRSLLPAVQDDMIACVKRVHGALPDYMLSNPGGVVDDFVMMSCFVGNDFLPHIPVGFISERALDNVLECYASVAWELGGFLTCDGRVNLSSLSVLLAKFGDVEMALLRRQAIQTNVIEGENEANDQFLRDLYFRTTRLFDNGGVKDVAELSRSYVQGLEWVWGYYSNIGTPSWSWTYPAHYAPFVSDMAEFLRAFGTTTSTLATVPKSAPLPPLLQLLCILPRTSSSLLPTCLRALVNSNEEGQFNFFPNEWEVDATSADKEFQNIARLPFLDAEALLSIASFVMSDLTPEEARRNVTRSEDIIVGTDGKRSSTSRAKIFPLETQRCFSDVILVRHQSKQRKVVRVKRNGKKSAGGEGQSLRDEQKPGSDRLSRSELFQLMAVDPVVDTYYLMRYHVRRIGKAVTLATPSVGTVLVGSLVTAALAWNITRRSTPLGAFGGCVWALHYGSILGRVVSAVENIETHQHEVVQVSDSDAHVDWYCSSCRTLNFQRNMQCWMCARLYVGKNCPLTFIPVRRGGTHFVLDHSQEVTVTTLDKGPTLSEQQKRRLQRHTGGKGKGHQDKDKGKKNAKKKGAAVSSPAQESVSPAAPPSSIASPSAPPPSENGSFGIPPPALI
eukprot:PhM_4_TR2969/c0_g1_i1/m.38950/K12618/XRN1, SEP1, KEM1; 5'-3' exoribonuclease 1